MYKFRDTQGLEDFLLDTLGVEFLIPSSNPGEVAYFHNGDKMTVNVETGEIDWEPISPGNMFTSRLSLRFHQWFGKGIIETIKKDRRILQ